MKQAQVLHHFCTLFDSNYLLKGVAMIRSLAEHCPGAHVHVLCMDAQTGPILEALGLPVTCIALAELETDELRAAKRDRSVAEYCWTLSPSLPWYVLQQHPKIDAITYVDADLLFYSPVQPLFDEIGGASIAIIEHRFTPRLQHLEVNGRFCVEWVGFRRDAQGLACLDRWRMQCIEWCYYRLEGDRMGDQKYLDAWPQLHGDALHILEHPGAGIAPWNYAQYSFSSDATGTPTVDDAPLIFYHFHQFQLLDNGGFDRLSTFYTSECREPQEVYERYERSLQQALVDVRSVSHGFSAGLKPAGRVASRRWVQRHVPRWLKDWVRRIAKI
jgi:hypothetical protein